MGSKVRKGKKGGKCMNINVIAEVDEKGELQLDDEEKLANRITMEMLD